VVSTGSAVGAGRALVGGVVKRFATAVGDDDPLGDAVGLTVVVADRQGD
jgi:hypothetical protein